MNSEVGLAHAVLGPVDAPATDMLGRLLHACRVHLGMDVAFIAEVSPSERTFRYVDADGSATVEVGGSDPLEETYCQRVLDGRLPELIRDPHDHEAAMELAVTTALPVGGHISVPLVLPDGRVYGTFCCFRNDPDPTLTDRDLRVVRTFADVAVGFLEADLAARAVREEAHQRVGAALRPDHLTTVYQPVIRLSDGDLLGVEALSRFRHGGRGPDAWFAEAESIGRGPELEARAVTSALQALPVLPPGTTLGLNASPAMVLSGALRPVLDGVDLDRIVLEMTEHAPIDDYDELNSALRPLRRDGLQLAVDDAGAGYASLRHILRLEPDWIKIDISITRDIDTDPVRSALAAALVTFAADSGSRLIAEGIETEAELVTLRRLGVTAGQGYHLARPARLPELALAGPPNRGSSARG